MSNAKYLLLRLLIRAPLAEFAVYYATAILLLLCDLVTWLIYGRDLWQARAGTKTALRKIWEREVEPCKGCGICKRGRVSTDG